VLADIQQIFQTKHPVVIYPASGTGAWEAALVNTLSPGDHVLMFETGHFAALWPRWPAPGPEARVPGAAGTTSSWRAAAQAGAAACRPT
jgi:alanine-glyoxylate transaminase/serine-glyoxylate transaminase/serine-pyruvate transaminase